MYFDMSKFMAHTIRDFICFMKIHWRLTPSRENEVFNLRRSSEILKESFCIINKILGF